jgi:hypothetical protein
LTHNEIVSELGDYSMSQCNLNLKNWNSCLIKIPAGANGGSLLRLLNIMATCGRQAA